MKLISRCKHGKLPVQERIALTASHLAAVFDAAVFICSLGFFYSNTHWDVITSKWYEDICDRC